MKLRTHCLISGSSLAILSIAQPVAAQQVPATSGPATTSPQAADQSSSQEQAAPAVTGSGQTAADGINSTTDIVITAERRVSTVQRTAASVTVRGGEELQEQGRYQLSDILQTVPGITGGAARDTVSSQGSGSDNPAAGLTIRGVPSNIGAGGSITSTAAAAAIYTDEIYNGIGSTFDLDRVEVLRGPQGTLYGRSATSGVVVFHTRDPDVQAVNGDLTAEFGNYERRHVTGALNVPIVDDKLAVRVSGNYYNQGGFYFGNKGGGFINKDVRVKLLYKPTDNFSALLGFALEDNQTYADGVSIRYTAQPGVYTITESGVDPGSNHFRQYWGEFNLDLGPVGITYIPAYRTWDQKLVTQIRALFFAADQSISTPNDYFHTEELRIHSNGTDRLQWQGGATYFYNKLNDANLLTDFPSGALEMANDSRKATLALGVFAEGTYSFTPETRFTGGIRYDYTRVRHEEDYTNRFLETKSINGEDATRKFHNVTFKARAEQDLAPGHLAYASISSGFSPGDVAITTDNNFQPIVVDFTAETLTAYEVGSKNRFLGGRLQINGAVFYNDYGGYQVANVNLSTDPQHPTFNTILTKLRSFGGELEAVVQPWAHGRFTGNISYTNSVYRDIPAQYQYVFSTNRVANVPPIQAFLAYDHDFTLGTSASLVLHGDMRYTSPYALARISVLQSQNGSDPFNRNDHYFLGNFSATLAFDRRYSITGYVRNVANSRVLKTSGVEIGSAELSDPRTYGVVLSAKF